MAGSSEGDAVPLGREYQQRAMTSKEVRRAKSKPGITPAPSGGVFLSSAVNLPCADCWRGYSDLAVAHLLGGPARLPRTGRAGLFFGVAGAHDDGGSELPA
jgi:hypothetical protein